MLTRSLLMACVLFERFSKNMKFPVFRLASGLFFFLVMSRTLEAQDHSAKLGASMMKHRQIGHPDFLSPHARPIVLHGGYVFVVNTREDTVDVIQEDTFGIVARIHVGVDPVGLALKPDGKEIWVSNHISDSVSVIDTDPTSPFYWNVLATIQDIDPRTKATRFDEPVGIAFASNEKAYVALSAENQIAVVNVLTRQVEKKLTIHAQDPRAIMVSEDRLYVVPFESNNQTQISGGTGELDGKLSTFDAREHVLDNNNVLSIGAVVDIVKHSRIPDRDLFVFDTSTDELIETVDSLGTLLYGMTVNSRGTVFIAQTDARNAVNGQSGTAHHGLAELENRAFLNQITQIDYKDDAFQTPKFINIEPLPPEHPSPDMALATPFAIQVSDDDSILVVSAAGSGKVFTLNASSGEVLGRVSVGHVPRGIALDCLDDGSLSAAWVLNAVANTVSYLDLSDPQQPINIHTVTLKDSTDPDLKQGRIAFNDANASSSATFSCESCHPDGHTDQLLWVLDTPISSGGNQIVPRTTMPARGLRDTAPYHWDGIPGDPYGGINTASTRQSVEANSDRDDPASSTRHLVDGALASSMKRVGDGIVNDEGKAGALTALERGALARFLLSASYPPAQRRAYDNVPSKKARNGFRMFHVLGDKQGNPEVNVCGNCHRMPFWVSTNTRGSGMDAPTWRGAYDRWMILPQGRLNLIDFDFYASMADRGVPERSLWRLSWGSRREFDNVWDMVLEGSTGFSGAFARQVTLNESAVSDPLSLDLLKALELSSREGAVILQGEGVWMHDGNPVSVALDFNGQHYVDRNHPGRNYELQQLVSLANKGEFIGTFTGRLGQNVGLNHPQPALWSSGSIERQRGPQVFPALTVDQLSMTMSGRHIMDDAHVFINGHKVHGLVHLEKAEHRGATRFDQKVTVTLQSIPLGKLETKLVSAGGAAHGLVPKDGSLGTEWRRLGFDASDWFFGHTGFGYEKGEGYGDMIETDLEDAMQDNTSVFIRIPFVVENPSSYDSLEFRIQADDGFSAYINGRRIASRNRPRRLSWNSQATDSSAEVVAGRFETYDVSHLLDSLQHGENVLAIHGLNRGEGSSDFIIRPELVASVPAKKASEGGTGMHLIQLQNPDGLFSNDFIFHVH